MPVSFVDSNVLLYFASGNPEKADRAEELMKAGGIVSVQILNEVAAVSKRKFGLSWDEIALVSMAIRRAFDVETLTAETHAKGLAVARRYRLAIYDGMIVASALIAGCDTLWSEDMQDGLVVEDALTIRNPFSDL
jgi:predicted nucleic acid-binding protein